VSKTGNFAMELAEARVEQERDASVARVQSGLGAEHGSAFCLDCGAPIPAARRRALPSARRCIQCAQRRETGSVR